MDNFFLILYRCCSIPLIVTDKIFAISRVCSPNFIIAATLISKSDKLGHCISSVLINVGFKSLKISKNCFQSEDESILSFSS